MTVVVQLVGGPIDGRRIRLYVGRPAFVWVEQDERGKVFVMPAEGRLLFRRVRNTYVFAGHTHAVCEGCGAFSERVDGHVVSCSLCGGALARNVS